MTYSPLKMFVPQGQYFRKTDYVAESLRTSILLRYIPAGTRITEQQVRNALKVSSSPVREAFHLLTAEGLLVTMPHTGTSVPEMDINDSAQLYSVNFLLQSTAVQICTPRFTENDLVEAEEINNQIGRNIEGEMDVNSLRVWNYKFHLIVCGFNVYPWLTRLISALWIKFPYRNVWQNPQVSEVIFQQHRSILESMNKRNGVEAGARMKQHLEYSWEIATVHKER